MKSRKCLVSGTSTEQQVLVPREPTAVHFVIYEEGESETVLMYSDGSTGPLPPGKTYFDYLPEENKRRFIKALADLVVKDLLEGQRAQEDIGVSRAGGTEDV